jgi:hypothetical protein
MDACEDGRGGAVEKDDLCAEFERGDEDSRIPGEEQPALGRC